MKKYRCNLCGYIYEETEKEKFDELSDNYVCPICMGKKSNFEQISEIMLDKAPVNAVKIVGIDANRAMKNLIQE